jgi:hypothetical protein
MADAIAFKTADFTGKKANLHPLVQALWQTCCEVLVDQAHFATFQAAVQMNQNFQNTCKIEALLNLCMPNIVNPWKDAHAAYEGQHQNDERRNHDDEEEMEGIRNRDLQHRFESVPPIQKDAGQDAGPPYGLAVQIVPRSDEDHNAFHNMCANENCGRPRQYNFGCDWGCCCKRCFTSDGVQHDRECDAAWNEPPPFGNVFESVPPIQKDKFEEFVDGWHVMAKPGEEVPVMDDIDALFTLAWDAEVEKASEPRPG